MSARDYLTNRTITADINLLIKNSDKIFKLFNLRTIFSSKPNSNQSFLEQIKKLIFFDQDSTLPNSSIKNIDTDSTNIFFVNGILTSENEAIEQKKLLSSLLNTDIGLLYNKSGGLLIDLLESSYDRNIDNYSNATKHITKFIIFKLKTSSDILTLIGHSQGATLINKALNLAQKELNKEELKNIKFITFGAAINQCNLDKNILTEHFVNTEDPIPNLGLLINNSIHSGKIYKREATGHFFAQDYLMPLSRSEFGIDSYFYQQLSIPLQNNEIRTFLEKYPKEIIVKNNKIKKI